MLQWVARKLLAQMGDPDEKYAVGDVVQFPTPDGTGSYAGVVQRGRAATARRCFDFNHPLAGQPVTFEVAADRRAVTTPSKKSSWPSRAAFAPASTAPSRSSSARCSKFGAPIYVRHEIVHNTFVVNDLKAKGAIFIEDLADVPPGSTLVFSAHGVQQGRAGRGARRAASASSTPPARW